MAKFIKRAFVPMAAAQEEVAKNVDAEVQKSEEGRIQAIMDAQGRQRDQDEAAIEEGIRSRDSSLRRQREKLAGMKGRAGTILTGLGTPGSGTQTSGGKTLLGL